MTTYAKRRGVHMTDADLDTLAAKGFTYHDSWKPQPVLTADMTESPSRSNRYGSGFRTDLGIYVRSTWEANVSRVFNWQQAHHDIDHWEYEPDEFEFPVKRGSGKFYKPDFKIWTTTTTYHRVEVKGQMTAASATKLKRMQKYYPHEQIILIRAPQYRELERTYAPLIPEWEYDKPRPHTT